MKDEQDYIRKLGALALASRLRRLLHRLHADGARVYESLHADFKPTWFPVLHLLTMHRNMTLMQLSSTLAMTHPSVIEIVEDMTQAGLVSSQKSLGDGRRREISLTPKGRRKARHLEPVWNAFRLAGDEVSRESGNDFMGSLTMLEAAMDRSSMYERITSKLERQKSSERSQRTHTDSRHKELEP